MNFRYALRALRKRPGFTFIAVAALTLGIGWNTAIFSVVEAVLLRSLPFPHPEELVRIAERTRNFGRVSTSDPNFLDWSRQAKTIAAATEMRPVDYTLTGMGEAQRWRTLEVSAAFFAAIAIAPALGRAFRPEEDQPNAAAVVVLTDELWRREFGAAPSVIGRTLDLNGKPFTIVGVMPAAFSMPTLPCDILAPAGLSFDNERGDHRGEAFARLKPGVTLPRAQA